MSVHQKVRDFALKSNHLIVREPKTRLSWANLAKSASLQRESRGEQEEAVEMFHVGLEEANCHVKGRAKWQRVLGGL